MCFNYIKKCRVLLESALLLMLSASFAVSADPGSGDFTEETMLMFVGESQPMVTVASRFPESPTSAPAMVTIVGREEIQQRGYETLAELLAAQPGFFIASRGRGSVPYLRGMRDSILFLYDGVPITTDVTKNFAPIDREISLAAIERVEIVHGPGSVLWGPDAFAGVVNVVPLQGLSPMTTDVRLVAGSQDLHGMDLGWRQARRQWKASLFLNGVRHRYHEPDYIANIEAGRLTFDEVDLSEYSEIVGTWDYDNWLHISGRWSGFSRRYTLRNATEEIVWPGKKEAPVNHLKVSASRVYGPSHYVFNGYYQQARYEVSDADIAREQRNQVVNLELLWDRRVFERGLLSVGASWRRNAVDGALVRDGFLPEFLSSDQQLFAPNLQQSDFVNQLTSAFSQFRYQAKQTSWWVGARVDDHSQYQTTLSYSVGFHRPLGKSAYLKANYGTAFRSPYSSQLFDDVEFEPESVRTASVQFVYEPTEEHLLSLSAFHSTTDNDRFEDAYGGLSIPVSRKYYGFELSGQMPLSPSLIIRGSSSVVSDSGGGDDYKVLRFCFLRPDGSQVCEYDEWNKQEDTGPAWTAALGLNWQFSEGRSLDVSARTAGRFDYSYRRNDVEGQYSQPVLIDLNYRHPGVFRKNDSLSIHINNLLDQDYSQPDLYGPTRGEPLQLRLVWNYRF